MSNFVKVNRSGVYINADTIANITPYYTNNNSIVKSRIDFISSGMDYFIADMTPDELVEKILEKENGNE